MNEQYPGEGDAQGLTDAEFDATLRQVRYDLDRSVADGLDPDTEDAGLRKILGDVVPPPEDSGPTE